MKKILIDTNPGVDDTLAMAMLFETKQQVEWCQCQQFLATSKWRAPHGTPRFCL